MEPIHFGGDRTLFGVRSEASGSLRQTAVVICPSWGAEYMRAYRSLHLLSIQIAERGFDVLRFDYSSTGDSAGPSEQASVKNWVADIRLAVQTARADAGTTRVCLLGVRLGALLAVRAALEGDLGAVQLALWDLPRSGQHWIDESRRMDAALSDRKNRYSPGAALLPPQPDELLGMPFLPGLAAEVAGLNPTDDWAARCVLWLRSADAEALAPPSGPVVAELPDAAHWNDPAWVTRPWTPARSLRAIAERLSVVLQ